MHWSLFLVLPIKKLFLTLKILLKRYRYYCLLWHIINWLFEILPWVVLVQWFHQKMVFHFKNWWCPNNLRFSDACDFLINLCYMFCVSFINLLYIIWISFPCTIFNRFTRFSIRVFFNRLSMSFFFILSNR